MADAFSKIKIYHFTVLKKQQLLIILAKNIENIGKNITFYTD